MPPEISTKPYLIRAIHAWCSDNGYSPYIVVVVRDSYTQVPQEYVEDDEIVLNIASEVTDDLMITNDYISFLAYFGDIAHKIMIPIGAILSIFSHETGNGMRFEYEPPTQIYKDMCIVDAASINHKNKLAFVSTKDNISDDPSTVTVSTAASPKLTIIK